MQLEVETQNNLHNKQIGDDLECNSKVYVVDKNWYTHTHIYIYIYNPVLTHIYKCVF
jgi:hypothetical protein